MSDNPPKIKRVLYKCTKVITQNKKQIGKVNNFLSRETDVASGVPQGSHLGPFLFKIFINDITLTMPSGCHLLFANDLKLFGRILLSTVDDAVVFQSHLQVLSEWCADNMELNVSKCHIMHFHCTKRHIVSN